MASKPVEKMTWADLDRIIKSECQDKGFIERARKAILMRTVGKTVEEMKSEDLDYIISDGCKDEELIERIRKSIRAQK